MGLLWSLCGVAGVLGGIFSVRALDGRFAFVVLPIVLATGGMGALLKTAYANADYPRVLSCRQITGGAIRPERGPSPRVKTTS